MTQKALLSYREVVASRSEEETYRLGQRLASLLKNHPHQVVAVIGEMGAGKTTLLKAILHALTHTPYSEITSPTFQYVSTFTNSDLFVAHFDLWRLSEVDEFLHLGLGDVLEKGLSFIEWPDRIAPILPHNTVVIDASWTEELEKTYSFFRPYHMP